MDNKDHDDILELIPAYALGALDAGEAEAVRQHLAGCNSCREALEAHEAIVDALSLAVPEMEPPPHLKDHLTARARTLSAATPSIERSLSVGDRFRVFLAGSRWRPALIVGVVALLAAAIFLWRASGPVPLQTIDLVPTAVAPGAGGIIVFTPDRPGGTLSVTGLPPLGSDLQYQLWLIVDGQRTSGAVFSVDAEGAASVPVTAERPLADYGAFGITIEPAGGSPGPTGDRVLGHNL